jgi:hypothetical protein
MCASEEVSLFEAHVTRNGSIVGTSKGSGGEKIKATVIKSVSPEFPVGTQVEYQNGMGHVLCGGNDSSHQDKCLVHPLDQDHRISGGGADTVRREITTALGQKFTQDIRELVAV